MLRSTLGRLIARIAVAGALFAAGAAQAASCPDHYLDGRAPEIRNQNLAAATRELCYGVFGVMHSGKTRTPLWSAEHVRAGNLERAENVDRKSKFHAEKRLPRAERAELDDYARSGFDRGHLAPSANMPDRRTQTESFSLANMVPQDREHNRAIWAPIENAVRQMARKEGELYVITGPAFLSSSVSKVGNVLVPSHLYKVVYSPRQRLAAAWFTENRAEAPINVVPVAELERIVGIELLPSLSTKEKERMLRLPKIKQRKKRS